MPAQGQNSANSSEPNPDDLAAFDRLTESASALMDSGELDVYSMVHPGPSLNVLHCLLNMVFVGVADGCVLRKVLQNTTTPSPTGTCFADIAMLPLHHTSATSWSCPGQYHAVTPLQVKPDVPWQPSTLKVNFCRCPCYMAGPVL